MKNTPASLGAFHWHNAAQFGGALNDNLFKLAVIYAMVHAWPEKDTNEVNAVVGAVFAIPFLLFLGAAGVLADRVAKHRIVLGIKWMEVGVMTLGAAGVFLHSREIMLLAMFAMSVQSALFSPTKFSIVPELVGRGNISRANSFMSAASYLAMIIGTAVAPVFYLLLGRAVGLSSVVIAALGLYAATRIPATPVAGGSAKASVFFLRDVYRTLKWVHHDGFLALAVWSSAYFLMIAAFVQLNMLTYGMEHLGMASQQQATSLFLVVAFGIGAGSLLAGKISRHGVEFGMVPLGSALLAVSCVGLWAIPREAVHPAYGFSFIMGLGAGLFVVPLQSFLQYRSPPEKMGEVIAASGWLSWLGVLLAAGLLYLCSAILGLTGAQSFLLIGGLIAILALISFACLPDFLVRVALLLITRSAYRLRTLGAEHLPALGPALIVCSRAGKMDALWVAAIQQRRIRFLMSRNELASRPFWIRSLLLANGVISVPRGDAAAALADPDGAAVRALEDGFLLAVFAGPDDTDPTTPRVHEELRRRLPPTLVPWIPLSIDVQPKATEPGRTRVTLILGEARPSPEQTSLPEPDIPLANPHISP